MTNEPMKRPQERLLVALVVVLAIAEFGVPVIWADVSHGLAIQIAVLAGAIFVIGAVILSASLARSRGTSFWSVLLLRDRGETGD